MERRIFRSILLTTLLIAPVAQAAQFASVIDAMGIQSSATHTNNGWEDTTKIKGVKWNWPYNQSGAHDYTLVGATRGGKVKNHNVAPADVTVSGARTFITDIQITVADTNPGLESFGPGKITRIKTSCDSDVETHSQQTHLFEKPGYKPLVISHSVRWGTRVGGATYRVAYTTEDALRLFSPRCRVLP